MEDSLMNWIGMPAIIGIVAFYLFYLPRCAYRFYCWLFVREYIMTSDTIIRVVGWWTIYAQERLSPNNVVHWSPEEDTQDDGN